MSSTSISLADVSFKLGNKKRIYNWIKSVVVSEKKEAGDLIIVLCSDDYLLDINKRFLGHQFYTDIISFDYTEGKIVSGELYISIDRVKDNAKKYNVEVLEELNRVMIHGVLHLCGYKDKTPSDIKKMRKKEEEKLNLLLQ